jgi:hypothetical protein
MFAESIPGWLKDYQPPDLWQSKAAQEVNHDYVTLLSIEAEHCKWMNQIEQALLGDISFRPPALKPGHCRFGRWYYDYGQQRYGDMESFRKLEASHNRVHKIGIQLIEQHYGKHSVTQEEMEALNRASEKLLQQVSQLLIESADG